jgi:hypothetical protein
MSVVYPDPQDEKLKFDEQDSSFATGATVNKPSNPSSPTASASAANDSNRSSISSGNSSSATTTFTTSPLAYVATKLLMQIKLLVWKRCRETVKNPGDFAKLLVPPMMFFAMMILFYSTFGGLFSEGALEVS